MNPFIIRRPFKISADLEKLHPILQRIYCARNIQSMQDLSRELQSLYSFDSLKDITKAVTRIALALQQQQNILVIGDFDADGATSTALVVSALRAFGAKHVVYLVPNRFTFGYGLTPEIVEVAKNYYPHLIITVDNGISSHAGIIAANHYGIEVIVTDHHLAGHTLPPAYAIVNPNQPDDHFPSKNLSGVGVAFYVMLALRSYLNTKRWFALQQIPCPNMAQFLDLVALGTIADVVPLDKNNRILIHQGLRRIRGGLIRPGIAALFQVAGKDPKQVKALDMGFALAPRLNAAGRLDDMSLGIACLIAPDMASAYSMARQLDELNKERRVIESQMKVQAFSIVKTLSFDQKLNCGVCLFKPDWHQGVVGLVAARVKEKINRPVIAFARAEDGITLKGSARSIEGLHIRDVIESVATQHPHLVSRFGGHAMAAGLSILENDFNAFSEAFSLAVSHNLNEANLEGKLESDGELSAHDLNLEFAELLDNAGPWGQGFPEPVFDGKFNLVNQRIVGNHHLKLVLQLPNSDHYLDGIAFNINLEEWPNYNCRVIDIAYRLDINEYKERRRLQLLIEKLQVAGI